MKTTLHWFILLLGRGVEQSKEDNVKGSTHTVAINCFSLFPRFQLTTSGNQAFLTTTGPLDREETESYHMLILASDGGVNSLSATANIFVTVEDRNDNPPEFDLSTYTVDVIEETTYLSNCFSVQVRGQTKGGGGGRERRECDGWNGGG